MAKTTAAERMAIKEIADKVFKAKELLETAKNDLGNIISERESFFDDKSEKWQESDNGTDYSGLTTELENIDIESLESSADDVHNELTDLELE